MLLLHLMRSAFAIEDVPRLASAFAFAPLRLFAAADIRASFVAAENLLLGRGDRLFSRFRHFQLPLVESGNRVESIAILTSLAAVRKIILIFGCQLRV